MEILLLNILILLTLGLFYVAFAAGSKQAQLVEARLSQLTPLELKRDDIRKQMSKEGSFADRVLFVGKQSSVAELLSCSDLFLLMSETEAFGLVALEAMSCGGPVIATRTGGVPEVVEDGISGFLADVGDVDAMGAAGTRLLSDSDEWTRFSGGARRSAERFSADRVVTEYENFYMEVLGR